MRGSDFGAAAIGEAFDAGVPSTPASACASSSTTPPLTPWSRSSFTPSATATDLPPAVLVLPSPAITHDLSGVPSRMQTVWPTVTGISWLSAGVDTRMVAIAGVLLAVRTNFDPAIGPARLIFGFEAVIIGGLGSMWGTLAGGIILGVSQAIGAQINPGWQLLAGHLAFLLILALRPEGLFPKVKG